VKTFKDRYFKSAQLWNKPVVLADLFNEDEEPVSNRNSLVIIDVYIHHRRSLIFILILKLFFSFLSYVGYNLWNHDSASILKRRTILALFSSNAAIPKNDKMNKVAASNSTKF
jgi:hypothetical protein